jgi:hypothetical protein
MFILFRYVLSFFMPTYPTKLKKRVKEEFDATIREKIY